MGARKLVNVVHSGLGAELKFIREGRGRTLDVICDQLMWPLSKLSRMENAKQCISDIDLGALLALYGVHGNERQRLLHMADRQDDPGRWEVVTPQEGAPRTLMRLEQEAIAIVDAEPVLVPGIVQTADYARVIIKSGHVLPEQVEPRVEARISRRGILTKAHAPKVDLILDESALRRVVGSHKVMARQLRAVLEVAELPNVRLWIVPLELGGNAGVDCSFYLMDLPRGGAVVLLESTTSGVFREDRDEIDFFRRRGSRLVQVALDPAKSVDFVANMRKEYERE